MQKINSVRGKILAEVFWPVLVRGEIKLLAVPRSKHVKFDLSITFLHGSHPSYRTVRLSNR